MGTSDEHLILETTNMIEPILNKNGILVHYQVCIILMWIRNPRWPPTRALVFNKMIDGDPIGKWINTLFSNFAHG